MWTNTHTTFYAMIFLLQSIIVCDTFTTSTPLPDNVDFLNFSVIEDAHVRHLAKDFNSMCPHTRMCKVEIDYDESLFQSTGMTWKLPCCGWCECGNDCLKTLDCCPDALPRLLTSEEVHAINKNPLKCIEAQFRPSRAKRYNGKTYTMVAKCVEPYSDKAVMMNCHKEYSDFDFKRDIPDFLPVTDNTTMVTYKNKYCALCNLASTSDLVFWSVSIGSGSDQDSDNQIQSLSAINELFKTDINSNAVFHVPLNLEDPYSLLQTCNLYIDQCNVTGLWKEYDEEIESLCVSYLSAYKGYKNVHCYLCNGFDRSTIVEICEEALESWQPSSFATLLDFNNLKTLEEGNTDQAKHCHNDEMYDKWANTCRQLTCPETMLLGHNKCWPPFSELPVHQVAAFDTTLRLIPLRGYTDVRNFQTLKQTIEQDADRKLSLNFKQETIFLCNVQMFIKLNKSSYRNQLSSDSCYNIEINHIAVRFIVCSMETKNMGNILQNVIKLLYSLNDCSITDEFTLEYADVNFSVFDTREQQPSEYDYATPPFFTPTFHESSSYPIPTTPITQASSFSASPTNPNFKESSSNPRPTSPIIHESPSDYISTLSTVQETSPYHSDLLNFLNVFDILTDPVNGLVILLVRPMIPYPSPKSIRLYPFLFCPTIFLSENEFSITDDRKEIFLKHKNIYINASEVVFSSNDSAIMLCSTDYISWDGNVSGKPETHVTPVYTTEVLVSIICTSISLLSLLIVFIIYCSFKILRTLPGLNNMALVLTLFFAQLLYLVGGVIEIPFKWLCEVIGFLLHFSLAASFFWMAVCTFHMMRVFVFVSNLAQSDNNHIKFIKYATFVTLSSIVLVAVNITVSMLDDSSIGYGGQPCYITRKNMILYIVAVPLGVVIVCNLFMFLFVIIKVSRLPDVKKNTKHERRNIVIFFKLSTLTGLTWIFAYLYQWTNTEALMYLFIIANASQGVFIMFSFIMNRRVYNMINMSYRSSSLYQVTHKTRSRSEEGTRK